MDNDKKRQDRINALRLRLQPSVQELRLNLLGDPIIIHTEDPSRVKARHVASGLAKLTPEEKAALGLEEVSK